MQWDSAYLMIRQLQLLQQPIDAFLDHPNNRDLKKYKLSQMEWKVLVKVCPSVPLKY
ncbi:hypothetical protein PISMIDRAFT_16512 [Pisolithus microcarpus 441]|uniref:Uncharacterized protein n=1 Tax=Pisolithus microcarpus 441 TaxID=765257 RepID=A0A0C9YNQ3_9AGAM|nr:hypothetical protein PISMIDRAFT_16512 [Pisolithus microcarpus 441]